METQQVTIADPSEYPTSIHVGGPITDFATNTNNAVRPIPGTRVESFPIEDIRPTSETDESDIIREVTDAAGYKLTGSRTERNIMSSMYLSAEEKLQEVEIEAIDFGLYKREELEQYAVLVDSDEIYGQGTINDSKLGVVMGNERCGTCHRDVQHCPGHLGRIKLKVPIINPWYKKRIISFLTIFCNKCGALLLDEKKIKELEKYKYAPTRLKLIEDSVKSKSNVIHTHSNDVCEPQELTGVTVGKVLKCPSNPVYKRDTKGYKVEYVGSDGHNHERTIEDIVRIFNSVKQSDAQLIGLGNNMPIDFIMFNIIVIPPKLRGAGYKEAATESDRMADLYISIIKANKMLKKLGDDAGEEKKENYKKIVYEKLRTLLESKETKSSKGINQVSVLKLLQGKEGIFRQYIMSKRADFTARSVIGPNPELEFGEVSVPIEWASKLTVPERVFQLNKARLNRLLQEGKITHVTKNEGLKKGMLHVINNRNKDHFVLDDGDMADRWLEEGDYLTLNRMPSLHKQSMMSMKVKFWNQRNLGLHLSYTTPYNADFDGDEMNVHSFQIIEAIAEAQHILNVEQCIPNEKNNSPIIGLVMDNVVAGYLLTLYDDVMDVAIWNDCIMRMTYKDDLVTLDQRLLELGVKKYTGKALFSALLPENLYYEGSKGVRIVKGVLTNGIITKEHIGPTAGSLIQAIYNNPYILHTKKDYDPTDMFPGLSRSLKRTALFINDASKVLNRWLTEHGFTIGLRDCGILNPDIEPIKKKELVKLQMLVTQLSGRGYTTEDERKKLESEISVAASNFRNNTGKILEDIITEDNNFKIMVASKSKGSDTNLMQVAVAVGQQTFFGERMKFHISNGKRTLPHFMENDDDVSSRGFIYSSFSEGLSAIEYFFHAAGSREGLLQSAMSISDIGEIRRDLFKMFEDCKILPDGTARDSNNKIIQSVYGDDGYSSALLIRLIDNKESINKDNTLVVNDLSVLAGEINSMF